MRTDEQEAYIDQVAQAVIDRIEERDRIAGLVETVAQRVLQMQQDKRDEAVLAAAAEGEPASSDFADETTTTKG